MTTTVTLCLRTAASFMEGRWGPPTIARADLNRIIREALDDWEEQLEISDQAVRHLDAFFAANPREFPMATGEAITLLRELAKTA